MARLDSRSRFVRQFGNYKTFFALDYSQVEIRILAEMSRCENLIRVIKTGMDIHAAVGHDLTGAPAQSFMSEGPQRKMIKAIHFGIVYGTQPAALHDSLRSKGVETTEKEVVEFFEAYFEKYREVREFIEDMRTHVQEHGYVSSLFGMRVEIAAYDEGRSSFWLNRAINSPIQSSAHTLMLVAMAEIRKNPERYDALREVLMEVHDALYWLQPIGRMEEAYEQGKDLLENRVVTAVKERFGIELQVPLIADSKAGLRLGVMIPYSGEPPEQFIEDWRIKNTAVEVEVQKTLDEVSRMSPAKVSGFF
jgi:DNA polymerase I